MENIDLTELNKNRVFINDIFEKTGEVEVVGWVDKARALGKIRFLVLRDKTGFVQVTGFEGKCDEKVFEIMDGISRESVVYVKGELKDCKQAPGGKEITPSEIKVINKAEDLPIDVSEFSKTELPKRLDYRFLDLHRIRTQAIFKIQSEITNSFREYFYKKNFMEVQLPSIISSSSEGGTDLFSVEYFDKKVYLAQSPQLYKQMLACSVGNVFTIAPVWRAEKHNTVRHLNECRQMDVEMSFAGQKEAMEELGSVVQFIVKNVLERCKREVEILGLKLKVPEIVYLSYDETVKKLGIEYGEDLSPENEKELDKLYPDSVVMVHSWPVEIKPFYIMPKDEDESAKLSEGFDAIYRGLEITSGGQRIHLPELLSKMIEKKGLDVKGFKEYIDSFRYGAPPHAGWSIGLERITQLITEEKNIREAVLFPRDRDRLNP